MTDKRCWQQKAAWAIAGINWAVGSIDFLFTGSQVMAAFGATNLVLFLLCDLIGDVMRK